MKKKLITLLLGILLIGIVSAEITVSPSSVSLDYSTTSNILTFSGGTNETLNLTLSSNLLDIVELSSSTIIFPSNQYVIVFLKNNAPLGSYSGLLNYGPGSILINANLVNTTQPEDPNACTLNPSLILYSQTVQQGTVFELPKILFNPRNCQGTFSIVSAYVSGGITTPSGQKPVFIKTASSQDILLGVDTTGLSSVPYTSKLSISAFGQTFTDVATITIIVTGGTNPTTTFDVNNLPTCSLSANILNLNSTYTLNCVNIVPGIEIIPVVDSEYIKGLGIGDGMSSTNFVWKFTTKKFGTTKIKADFRYLNLPVGDPFSQDVSISSSGSILPGTTLKLLFTPSLSEAQSGQNVLIQIVDNSSGSLVSSPRLWINALEQNSSTETFEFPFSADMDYSIRAKASGYEDLTQTVRITPQVIDLTITPGTGNSQTFFNITSSIQNISLFLNGNIIPFPYYSTLPPGVNLIKATKNGYQTKEMNFTVGDVVRITAGGDVFKKNVLQRLVLNMNVSYTVYYKNNIETLERTVYYSGQGSIIEFTPEESGVYMIEADNRAIGTYTIEGFNWGAKWWFMAWYWWIIGFVILIFIAVYYATRNKIDTSNVTPYS